MSNKTRKVTKKRNTNMKKHYSKSVTAKKYHSIYGKNNSRKTIRSPVALFL